MNEDQEPQLAACEHPEVSTGDSRSCGERELRRLGQEPRPALRACPGLLGPRSSQGAGSRRGDHRRHRACAPAAASGARGGGKEVGGRCHVCWTSRATLRLRCRLALCKGNTHRGKPRGTVERPLNREPGDPVSVPATLPLTVWPQTRTPGPQHPQL